MDKRKTAGPEQRQSIRQRLRRRFLWGMSYYPMVLLLGMVLLSIHATDALGGKAWIVIMGAIGLGCGWVFIRRGPARDPRPPLGIAMTPWISLGWMFAIGGAFAIVHDHARHRAKTRLEEWHATVSTDSSMSLVHPNAWQPIAVRATLEEGLRYRRTSRPSSSTQTAEEQVDASDSSSLDPWQTLTRVRIRQVRRATGWHDSGMTASLVIDEKVRHLYPGDSLEIYGHWRLPPEPSNPGQFDLRSRYAELGLTVQLKADSAEQLRRGAPESSLRMDRFLAMTSGYALETIERYVPFGQASLTAALVLGQREQAQWQLQEELLSTGTIHMLSISGMHIEMVAVALIVFGLILRLPRHATLIGTVVICVLYALLCGANPPVARATWMLSAGCIARILGWQFTSLNLLALAALLILTQRTSIAFEVGTQLSFLTVAVLILTFPILHRHSSPLERLLEGRQTRIQVLVQGAKRFAWESLRSSFWVCFLSAPLVWSNFHIISPIAIVLNLVLWLPMFIALLSGLALIALGWLPPVAAILGMMCGGSLWIMTRLVNAAESIAFGHFWVAAPPTWWMVGFYVMALAIALWRGTKRASARRLLWRSLGLWFAIGLLYGPTAAWWRNAFRHPDQGVLALTWIDVGHGTCAVIETPNGELWLYDAGRLGDHERSYQPIVNCLWHLGYSRVDRMILSHADSDHYNAMPGVMKRFFPKELVTTDDVVKHVNPTLVGILRDAQRQRARIETWSAGDRYRGGGGWEVEAIHPVSKRTPGPRASDNAKSLCLVIRYAGRTLFLPGDLEPPGTQQVIAQPSIDVDVMMAPHHGSLSAQAERVVAWANPEAIVISGSARAVSKRVVETYTPKGGRLWITARDHAVRIEIDASGRIRTLRWRSPHWEEIA